MIKKNSKENFPQKIDNQNNNSVAAKDRMKTNNFPLVNKIIIGFSVLVVLLGVYLLFIYQAQMEVDVSPENASITLNDQPVENNFTARPGEHSLEISAPGYLAYQKDIKIDYLSNDPIVVSLQEEPTFKVLDQISNLDQGQIEYLSYDKNKENLFYLKNQSCWRLNLRADEPKPERISPNIFKNVANLIWTTDHLGVIVQIDRPYQLSGTKFHQDTASRATYFYDFKRYDLLNQTVKFWDIGIGDIAINPDKTKVAYYYSTIEPESSLVISDIKRDNIKRVAKISEFNNPSVSWAPNKEYILIYDESKIFAYDSYIGRIDKASEDTNVQAAQMTADSKKILYLSPSPEKEKPASAMEIDGSQKTNLNFNLRLTNIDWLDQNRFIGLGTKDDRATAFIYNTSQDDFSPIALPQISSEQIKELAADWDSNRIFLIKDNQLVSLNIVNKKY